MDTPVQTKIFSSEGQTFKEEFKVEFGEGIGETSEEALNEAFKDALQKVVGVYVDSEFRVNNDEVIKDEILTHSNGFIDHYKKLEEGKATNGRGKMVTIRAWVKMQDFVERMKKMAPSQKVQIDGALLGSDLENRLNAEMLLRKELESFEPISDLMAISLVHNFRPQIVETKGENITLRYVYQIVYSKRNYENFIARITRVLDQIAQERPRERDVPFHVVPVSMYPIKPIYQDYARMQDYVTKGYYLINQQAGRASWEWKSKSDGVVSIVLRFTKSGSAKVREWKLSTFHKSVFDTCNADGRRREKTISCLLTLANQNGEALATASIPLRGEDLYGYGIPDFIPLLHGDGIRDVTDKSNFAILNSTTGGTSLSFKDRFVGYIDINIARSDVARVKSAEIKLTKGGYE